LLLSFDRQHGSRERLPTAMAFSGLEPRLEPLGNTFLHVDEPEHNKKIFVYEGESSPKPLRLIRQRSFPGFVPHWLYQVELTDAILGKPECAKKFQEDGIGQCVTGEEDCLERVWEPTLCEMPVAQSGWADTDSEDGWELGKSECAKKFQEDGIGQCVTGEDDRLEPIWEPTLCEMPVAQSGWADTDSEDGWELGKSECSKKFQGDGIGQCAAGEDDRLEPVWEPTLCEMPAAQSCWADTDSEDGWGPYPTQREHRADEVEEVQTPTHSADPDSGDGGHIDVVDRQQCAVPLELPADSVRAITTLMIRNLPTGITQQDLKDDLDLSFAGLYDFLYMPAEFGEGKGKGYAFINFTSSAAAGLLIGAWHLKRRFGASSTDSPLNISAASIQGREKNILKFNNPRLRRVRNPSYRPFVVGPLPVEARRAKYDSNKYDSNDSISGAGISEHRRNSHGSGDAVPVWTQAKYASNDSISGAGISEHRRHSYGSGDAVPLWTQVKFDSNDSISVAGISENRQHSYVSGDAVPVRTRSKYDSNDSMPVAGISEHRRHSHGSGDAVPVWTRVDRGRFASNPLPAPGHNETLCASHDSGKAVPMHAQAFDLKLDNLINW